MLGLLGTGHRIAADISRPRREVGCLLLDECRLQRLDFLVGAQQVGFHRRQVAVDEDVDLVGFETVDDADDQGAEGHQRRRERGGNDGEGRVRHADIMPALAAMLEWRP